MKSRLLSLVSFVLAAGLCIAAAIGAVTLMERRATADVSAALGDAGFGWARAHADGLRVDLTGTAPDEATRFRAASVAGGVVDPERVIDRMEVATRDPIAPPRFSMEILRGGEEITLIGLIPAQTDRQRILDEVAATAYETPITDLLETASYPAPEGWDAAVAFGLDALERTDRAKISVAADRLGVTTMAPDPQERDRIEAALRAAAPDGLRLALDVKVPRPVLTPFLLRLAKSPQGTELGACSADAEPGRDAILAAARRAGVDADAASACTLGLGAPSAAWSDAAVQAIDALATLDAGTLTIADLDIRLAAGPKTDTEAMERLAADLESALPEEFTLTALVETGDEVTPDPGPAVFTATRAAEGGVAMTGRLGTALEREAVDSFARALFGLQQVSGELEVAGAVPDGWSPRIFAALDALSLLAQGNAAVTEDAVRIAGTSITEDAEARIAELLARRIGDGATFDLDVTYDKRLDPALALPTPEDCAEQINAILKIRQITFAPGSDEIDGASRDSVDAIADVLRQCEDVTMEVAGFTDSQGGEEMNRDLSRSRADALIAALMARRIVTAPLTARGYGEEDPIADNGTEAGREANRRIEFRLLVDGEPVAGTDAPDELAEADGAEAEADGTEAEAVE